MLEIGDAEGDFVDDTEDDVDIDKLVTLPLVDLSVDIVVGTGTAALERLVVKVLADDRDKLDVVEENVLFRFANLELVVLNADNDGPADVVV